MKCDIFMRIDPPPKKKKKGTFWSAINPQNGDFLAFDPESTARNGTVIFEWAMKPGFLRILMQSGLSYTSSILQLPLASPCLARDLNSIPLRRKMAETVDPSWHNPALPQSYLRWPCSCHLFAPRSYSLQLHPSFNLPFSPYPERPEWQEWQG